MWVRACNSIYTFIGNTFFLFLVKVFWGWEGIYRCNLGPPIAKILVTALYCMYSMYLLYLDRLPLWQKTNCIVDHVLYPLHSVGPCFLPAAVWGDGQPGQCGHWRNPAVPPEHQRPEQPWPHPRVHPGLIHPQRPCALQHRLRKRRRLLQDQPERGRQLPASEQEEKPPTRGVRPSDQQYAALQEEGADWAGGPTW